MQKILLTFSSGCLLLSLLKADYADTSQAENPDQVFNELNTEVTDIPLEAGAFSDQGRPLLIMDHDPAEKGRGREGPRYVAGRVLLTLTALLLLTTLSQYIFKSKTQSDKLTSSDEQKSGEAGKDEDSSKVCRRTENALGCDRCSSC